MEEKEVKQTHTVMHPKFSLHKYTQNNQANDIFKYIRQEKLSEPNTCQTVKILLFFMYILSSTIMLNSSSRRTDIVQSIFQHKSENAVSCYSISNSTVWQSWNGCFLPKGSQIRVPNACIHQETGPAKAALKDLQFCIRNITFI